MKPGKLLVIAALALGLTSSAASAGSFTFDTPVGATNGGLPVNATTTITTGAGFVTVSLTNLQVNLTSVAQVITDLFFTLSGGNTAAATIDAANSSAALITIAGNGTVTPSGTATPDWMLDLSGASANGGSIHLCDIGGNPCGTSPDEGIIGPAGPGGVYTNANGSIAGNGPHNPFINQTATWRLVVPNVTSDTRVTAATFSFNTTAGDDVPGTPRTPVPEPASLALLGTGLTYLSARMRRRSAA